MIEFKMPSLGADMDSGTLALWHKKPGDTFQRGDIIADVETDKGVIEVEVWHTGKVTELLVEPGRKVAVGTVLALLQVEGEAEKVEAPRPAASAQGLIERTSVSHDTSKLTTGPERDRRLRISPLARKAAVERGIDLALIHGSGPYGAITKADVDSFPESSKPEASGATPVATAADRSAAMRHAIALAMSRSKREIPHYYLQTQINMRTALAVLEEANRNRPLTERLLPAALFLKAVAKACIQIPEMNGFWIDGGFHPSAAVHIGMGISLRQGGLIAPALHDVGGKNLNDVMRNMLDLVGRARSGKLKSSEISDATITVTNLGDQGVETVFGVIYPPQVAILGFGKISPRPWCENNMLGVAPMVTLTLAADHRASDGHRGGLFLNHIARTLEDPKQLEDFCHGS